MELDKEEILNELMNFEKNCGRDCESGLPDCLERFLINIAKSGDTIYPWNKIKPVILKKIELVVNEFNTKYPYENNPVLPNVKPFNFQEMKDEIIEKFDYFYGAPFTIQRICELLTDPSKYYKRTDKFMRGLEKNVRVISTIEARRADIENEPNSFQREFTRSPKNNSSPSSSASSSNILLSSPLPSSSTSLPSSSSSSSAFMNGLNDKEESILPVLSIASRLSQSCSPITDQGPLSNSPAPLQQLDSFTTVFASPPSTPLAVVSDIHPYDAGSPSSSSSSSSDSSPQPSSSSSPPPSLAHNGSELNQSIDTDFDDTKSKDDDSIDSKSEDSNEPTKLTDEPMDQTEEDKFDDAQEKLEIETDTDLIKLETSTSEPEPIKDDALLIDAAIKDENKTETTGHCVMKETNISNEPVSEEKESEITESISSLSESSSEKRQENLQKPPSITNEQTLDKLVETKYTQETVKEEPVEISQSSVVASTTDLSSGQKEKSDANEEDDPKCAGDSLNGSNDSIKTESTESANTSIEENLTQEKENDQDKDKDQGQEPTNSGSSNKAEITDNSLTTCNKPTDIDEKPESH